MVALSVSDAIDDARRFVAAESGLLIPVGLATFGLASLGFSLVAPTTGLGPGMGAEPWMLWLIPIFALVLTGHLSVSLLALRPRQSVADALSGAVRAMPRAVAIVLLMIGIATLMITLASAVGLALGLIASLGQRQSAAASLALVLPLLIWLGVRLTLLWPMLAATDRGAAATLREAFVLTRGHFAKLLLLAIANAFLYLLLGLVVQTVAGSVLLLGARLLEAQALGTMLVGVVMAGFNAVYMTFWAVLNARIYARLTA